MLYLIKGVLLYVTIDFGRKQKGKANTDDELAALTYILYFNNEDFNPSILILSDSTSSTVGLERKNPPHGNSR